MFCFFIEKVNVHMTNQHTNINQNSANQSNGIILLNCMRVLLFF